MVLVVGALLLALGAGVALAALRIGNDGPNKLFGTVGDGVGQDTLLGYAGNDLLEGRSAADQLSGDAGADRLYGQMGNDTLDGGGGRDVIYTGEGFDFVYARDGESDYINCNGEGNYRVLFDRGLDRIEGCPGISSAKSAEGGGETVTVVE